MQSRERMKVTDVFRKFQILPGEGRGDLKNRSVLVIKSWYNRERHFRILTEWKDDICILPTSPIMERQLRGGKTV